jgi:iron complex transport system ATP-binding protein
MIELSEVHFNRDSRPILQDINWHVKRNEHWVIIGPNGSGKTTLLNMIAGYEWPTSGTIKVLGHQYGRCYLPDVRKAIGWVGNSIQDKLTHHRINQLAVKQIVAAGESATLAFRGEMDENLTTKVRSALKRLGLVSLSEKPFSVLSQGEQKLALIARALIESPEILILDEPCAGLDPVSRVEFLTDLTRLKEEKNGPAILHITHHIEDINPWATHLLALKEGKVFYQGDLSNGITSESMSDLYGRPCKAIQSDGFYSLQVSSSDATAL